MISIITMGLAVAVVVPPAVRGESSARIALLTSGDRPMPSREASGPWKDNGEIWAAWEESLKPESFNSNWNGHPVGSWDHGWLKAHPGNSGIWRIMTSRINSAYAARHGKDCTNKEELIHLCKMLTLGSLQFKSWLTICLHL